MAWSEQWSVSRPVDDVFHMIASAIVDASVEFGSDFPGACADQAVRLLQAIKGLCLDEFVILFKQRRVAGEEVVVPCADDHVQLPLGWPGVGKTADTSADDYFYSSIDPDTIVAMLGIMMAHNENASYTNYANTLRWGTKDEWKKWAVAWTGSASWGKENTLDLNFDAPITQ